MRMKKLLALLTGLSLLACGLLPGCAAPAQGPNASLENAKGRYMERDVALPLPNGIGRQAVIGIWGDGEDVVYITYAPHPQGEEYVYEYFRHTLHPDGSADTASETWLNEGARLGGNELQVVKGEDGNLYAAFGDYTEDNSTLRCNLLRSRDGGQTYEAVSGPGLDALGMIVSMEVLQDGRILARGYDSDALQLLDGNGGPLQEFEAYPGQAAIAVLGNQAAYIAPGGEALRVRDMESGAETDYPLPYGKAPSYSDASWNAVVPAFGPDGSLYLATMDGLHHLAQEGTLWETLVDGEASNLGLPSFTVTLLAVMAGSPASVYLTGYDSSLGTRAFAYVFDPEAAQSASVELSVFSLSEDDTVRQAVVAFNRSRSDVKVTYTAALAGAAAGSREDYIKALNTELLAGKGPDILLLDDLPVSSYVEKGVLMDILPILDGAEPLLANIRQAYETEGQIFAFPLRVGFNAVLGKGAVLNAFGSLESLSAYAQTASAPVLGPGAFNYDLLAEFLLRTYGGALASSSGDPSAATAFLSDAKALCSSIGVTDEAGEGWNFGMYGETPAEVYNLLRAEGSIPQMSLYMQGKAEAVFMEMGALSGTTSMMGMELVRMGKAELGLANQAILPIGLVGVNQATKQPEAAADFLKTLFSQKVQNASLYQNGFPVNQAALESLASTDNSNISVGMNMEGLENIVAGWPEQAQRDQVMALVQSLHFPQETDPVLNDMLEPVVASCLSGEATVEEAASKLQSQLATYLSE